ncbi:MAG: hypothetical protein CSYNP_02761 [Syntrophus sp. SKADARSKE-3]|nr:hypothetical protein [Syntrophus sp. SKADARSKE-3]
MSKSVKRMLFAITGIIGLFILISIALAFFVDTGFYKNRLERVASEALGMEVRVGGKLGFALFPGLQIRLADVQIRNRGMDIVSVKEVSIEMAIIPLLHKEAQIKRIGLRHPTIFINRDRNGVFNFEAKGAFPVLILENIFFSDGALTYRDEQSGEGVEAGNFNLNVQSLRIAGGPELFRNLSLTAEFVCREIRMKSFIFSDVKFTCKGKDGIFAFNPVTLRLFGGQGSGSIEVDLSHPVPSYGVRSSLSKFQIGDYLKTLSSKKVAEGSMDFSASLSMRGDTAKEIMRTATGDVTLRGENLTLYGKDIDGDFARYESSQNFNLVDAGALFFLGPIGLAITKGYNFASTFQESGGRSSIGKLFSDWKVERGVAQAKDVAMTTKQNRIALKGKLNFVKERFENVVVALIDDRGCARVQQKIGGPFRKPVVEKPSLLMSLAGPALNLFKQARDLFTDGKCEAFYTGSVPAPK